MTRIAAALFAFVLPTLAAMAPARAAGLDDDALTGADVVLLGELHDDPAHHRAQAETIARMIELGLAPAVVFEMIPTDLQEAVDVASAAGDGADDFAVTARWEERGWKPFALWRPVVEVALGADLQILGGDLPANLRADVAKGGAAALEPWRRVRLALGEPSATETAVLGDAIRRGHCGLVPEDRLPAMIDVQRARDGSMAAVIAKAARRGPVVLIAGLGHVRRDVGVPAVLARTAPHLRVLAVAFGADGADVDGDFDQVVRTGPAPERKDPCAGLDASTFQAPAAP
ncbi:ChaN family lipoprotein [Oharaeibacter diazotrophicus]|uniref:Putative iron-regulated protein n=1 Tax=Oharaeibacter diazotrophicus TaxID=1920512 RepID=A0A4R6RFL1_9HYPH|nr:ChaN family lipoprotein [Oharaeibacter diazotrophicus]TDP84885.1 putative iron-regulated protein [Oharaeibacter diazotrophicus]BBE73856.1 hypothetical protein OHA_1_03478 [Pleomorphomonas sp. SM30]GLS76459.1 hypothetical protein GCM10007904_17940 [Oharaeibacter diazotrophicus]